MGQTHSPPGVLLPSGDGGAHASAASVGRGSDGAFALGRADGVCRARAHFHPAVVNIARRARLRFLREVQVRAESVGALRGVASGKMALRVVRVGCDVLCGDFAFAVVRGGGGPVFVPALVRRLGDGGGITGSVEVRLPRRADAFAADGVGNPSVGGHAHASAASVVLRADGASALRLPVRVRRPRVHSRSAVVDIARAVVHVGRKGEVRAEDILALRLKVAGKKTSVRAAAAVAQQQGDFALAAAGQQGGPALPHAVVRRLREFFRKTRAAEMHHSGGTGAGAGGGVHEGAFVAGAFGRAVCVLRPRLAGAAVEDIGRRRLRLRLGRKGDGSENGGAQRLGGSGEKAAVNVRAAVAQGDGAFGGGSGSGHRPSLLRAVRL